MKYIITLICCLVLSVTLFATKKWSANQAYEQAKIIHQVSKDIARDYWIDVNDCSIGWQKKSLWEVLYANAAWEWWLKTTWTPYSTNNPWSIHASQWIRPVVKTICFDWTCRWPVYPTMYDWFYEKAYLVAVRNTYNCNFNANNMVKYVKWSWTFDSYLKWRMYDMRDNKAPKYLRIVKELWLDDEPIEQAPWINAETPQEAKEIRDEFIKENIEKAKEEWSIVEEVKAPPVYERPDRQVIWRWIHKENWETCYVLHWKVLKWSNVKVLDQDWDEVRKLDLDTVDSKYMEVFNCRK